MSLDTILWMAGMAAEALVVVLCLRRRMFLTAPVFSSYIVWSLIVDIGFYYLRHVLDQYNFFYSYIGEMIIDSAFQFAVLVELGWAVLKPIRKSLPRHTILMLAGLILLAGAALWPIASWTVPHEIGPVSRIFVHLMQTVAALRVAVFLALACFSQMLSIGWRNRELQIATGLGIYSIARLTVSLLHTHVTFDTRYGMLEQAVVISYTFSLFYWIFTFAQNEQERQEFDPKMERFLLSVAGAARANRVAIANSSAGGSKHSRS